MKSDTPSHFSQPSLESIAERIRALRHQRGWSLADVEALSHGEIKAVVLGSYERCDRTMSLARAIQLADIFSVPLAHLLYAPTDSQTSQLHGTMMIDLRRAKSLAQDPLEMQDQRLVAFTMFISWILNQRGDWNGEILTVRGGDISTMALMAYLSEKALLEWVGEKRLLVTAPNRP